MNPPIGPTIGSTIMIAALLACSSPAPQPNYVVPEGCDVSSDHGWVVLQFDISLKGKVVHPKVVQACPPGKFDWKALSMVRGWKFQPTATGATDKVVKIQFESVDSN